MVSGRSESVKTSSRKRSGEAYEGLRPVEELVRLRDQKGVVEVDPVDLELSHIRISVFGDLHPQLLTGKAERRRRRRWKRARSPMLQHWICASLSLRGVGGRDGVNDRLCFLMANF
jgi:hypothetical protein